MVLKSQIIDEKILESISAITDKTRLLIIFYLRMNKRLSVNEITGKFKISRPAISHHLKVLKNCGILWNEKVGQETFYYLERSNIVKMLKDLADSIENCCNK